MVKTKKGMTRIRLEDGTYIDIEKVYLKHLNRDYGFTQQLIKQLAENKLLPTIYDWNTKKEPYFAKHELLELIEKMMTASMDLVDTIEDFTEKIEAANKVFELIKNAPEEVKAYFEPKTVEAVEE